MEPFLNQCIYNREKIYQDLVSRPDTVIEELWSGYYFPLTRDCEIRMDARNEVPGVRDISRCNSCQVLQPVITEMAKIDSQNIVPGVSYYNPQWEGVFHSRSFHVMSGKYQGIRLIVQRRFLGKPCRHSSDVPTISESMASCNRKKKMLTDVVLCDGTSSEILLSIMVQSLVPTIPKLIGIYSCGFSTYLVQESTIPLYQVDFAEFTNADIWGLVRQLWYYFYCLQDYQYSHSYPDVFSLNISKPHLEPLALEFGEFRLGIEQGTNSSIATANNSESGERRYVTMSILPLEDLPWIEEITQWQGTEHYVINSESIPMLIQKKTHGHPLYTKSLDLYCMLIGLCCNPVIRKVIIGHRILRTIFSIPGEVDILLERLSTEKYPNFHQTLDMLQGLRLKCDIVSLYPNLS